MKKVAIVLLAASIYGCNTNKSAPIKPNNKYTLTTDTTNNWEVFIKALAIVESRNNPNAVGKTNDAGIFQITPIYVQETNRILGKNQFTLQDRFSPEKSRIMFDIINERHNKEKSIIKAIKIHNPRASKRYQTEILQTMKSIEQ